MVCGRSMPATAAQDSPGDIRRLFIYRTTCGNAGFTRLRDGVILRLRRVSRGRLAALVPDRLGGLGGRPGVQVAAARDGGPECVVELVDQRDAGRDVQLGDRGVADAVQVLDQGAQRVAVRCYEHVLAAVQLRDHRVVPVREHAGHDVLEALGPGPGLRG